MRPERKSTLENIRLVNAIRAVLRLGPMPCAQGRGLIRNRDKTETEDQRFFRTYPDPDDPKQSLIAFVRGHATP